MSIVVQPTLPSVIGDIGAPLSSYVSQLVTIYAGQIYFDLSNGDMYIPKDWSDQNNLVWQKVYSGITSLATVAMTGSYNDLTNKPVPSFSSPNFASITTATQLSTTRDAIVNYVFPTSMTSLIASQSLTATLQYADDSGMSTNLVTVCSDVTGCSGILSLTLSGRLQLSGIVPRGKFRRVSLSQTGGATVPTTIASSQEVLL